MGCTHCFVVDLVEEIVGEGGSRSSSRVHKHENFRLVSQQNVAIPVYWSRCQPRSALIVRDVHHGKQQVTPFYHDLFRLPHWSSCCHEKNVFGKLLLEGKQQVSPFYRDLFRLRKLSSDLHERNVDDMLAQSRQQVGARDFHHAKQQVSPFGRTSQLAHSENFDFLVWFSPGFLMQ